MNGGRAGRRGAAPYQTGDRRRGGACPSRKTFPSRRLRTGDGRYAGRCGHRPIKTGRCGHRPIKTGRCGHRPLRTGDTREGQAPPPKNGQSRTNNAHRDECFRRQIQSGHTLARLCRSLCPRKSVAFNRNRLIFWEFYAIITIVFFVYHGRQ